MGDRPTIFVVAGANGVGKTTWALKHIRAVAGSIAFVNLDEIARGLSPLDPGAEQRLAARIALDRIRTRLAARNGEAGAFTIETTLSGRTYLPILAQARRDGWRVHLLYFAVRSVETCLERVARRVSEGGHVVGETDVRRRFVRSIGNFARYAAEADFWRVSANDGPVPATAAEGRLATVTYRAQGVVLPAPLSEALARLPSAAAD